MMWGAIARGISLGVVAILGTSCSTPLAGFTCETNSDCQSEARSGGLCEASQRCSFVDEECPSGRRYGKLAGDSSSQCVSEDDADAGQGDADQDTPDANPDTPDADPGTPDGAPLDAGPDAGLVCAAPVGTSMCPNVTCDGEACCVFLTGDEDSNCNDVCDLVGLNCQNAQLSTPGDCQSDGPTRACGHNNTYLLCSCN